MAVFSGVYPCNLEVLEPQLFICGEGFDEIGSISLGFSWFFTVDGFGFSFSIGARSIILAAALSLAAAFRHCIPSNWYTAEVLAVATKQLDIFTNWFP